MKRQFLSLLLLATLVLLAGCSADPTPYEKNDADGYTLSVRFDANGGLFTTNTSVIVDAYDPAALPQKDGKLSVALLAPNDPARGNDAFTPVKNGSFLAGWYAKRQETTDGQGNVTYTYSEKWDFASDRLEVAAGESLSSQEPVLTLYAAWVPLFQIEFYDIDTGTLLDTLSFDPNQGNTFQVPAWNRETGAMDLFRFPQKEGCTFAGAWYDPEGLQPVTGETVTHTGSLEEATCTPENPVMKLYLKYTEGEWFHIYNVEQFLKNASLTGCYEIHADLDFEEAIWPTALMYGNFSGTVVGNGHTFRNIQITQTNNSKTNAGLFGALTDTAKISDLAFENVTFTIQAGTRVAGTSYGLFAGSLSSRAEISGVSITNGLLQVDSDCYFGTEEYSIGLVCGTGSTDIDYAGITVTAVGNAPENVAITLEGQTVSVEITLE